MSSRTVPVLEIGGTHVTAAVVETGTWRVKAGTGVRLSIDSQGPADALITTMIDAGTSLRRDDTLLWGVAIPGPFHYARGVANFHGVGKFDALRGVNLGLVLQRALTGGRGHVSFVNDAEAFAAGEWVAGAARGHPHTIGVTLGTGIGSAFLIDGIAQRQGPGVPPDGRFDLVQVDGRPLEDLVSRRAIRARYADLTGDPAADQVDVREIATRARNGDRDAIRAVDDSLQVLGRVVAPTAVMFEAGMLVVGGSIALAWDVISPPLRSGMDQTSPGWEEVFGLAIAARGEDAALIGTAWHAMHSVTAQADG
ncbi:MAG TPA: ROK family protein [Jiangellaceae bacterium]|jgi:glucokinase|nr:ROK family protein [Jiangellaceae bacterium]